MASSAKGTRSAGKPYSDDLPGVGVMAILVPLIIGGAVVLGALILWQQHERKAIVSKTSRIEEETRREILAAYRLLRGERYDETLAAVAEIREQVDFLSSHEQDPAAYSDFKIALLLLSAVAKFAGDPAANAAFAEDNFNRAMELVRRASGETWEFVMMGRARARMELGKNDEAVRDLDVLIAGNPSYGSAYYWRSLAKRGLGDEAGALEDRKKAESLYSWPPLREPIRISEAAGGELFDGD